MNLVGEADARQEGAIDVVLQLMTTMIAIGRVPHGAECARSCVGNKRIKRALVVLRVRPTLHNLIPKTEVNCQVWAHLPVVLNEHLRRLLPSRELRSNGGRPVLDIAQKEVGVCVARSAYLLGLNAVGALRVGAGETRRCSVHVTPGCRVVLEDQVLAAEVEDMVSANQGHDIRGIEVMLLVRCCSARRKISLARPGVTGDVDGWEDVRLRELQPELRRKYLARALRCKEVELVGVSDSQFVDGARIDIPYIGDLRVIAVNVTYVAADGTGQSARVDGRVVALRNGCGEAVVRRKLVVEASEVFLEGLRATNRIVVVVARNASSCIRCARYVRQRQICLKLRRYRVNVRELVACELLAVDVRLAVRSN